MTRETTTTFPETNNCIDHVQNLPYNEVTENAEIVNKLPSEGSQRQQRLKSGAVETQHNVNNGRSDYLISPANDPSEVSSLLNLQTMREKFSHKCRNVLKGRSMLVDLLAMLFGVGTWVGVNGVFIQLPLLVNTAPEGWSLPSYLTVMVQVGNLSALFYTLWQRFATIKINDSHFIYIMLSLGTLSTLLTAFFYTKTATIFGEEHSIALFIFTILISINACTSAVLFMPYMGRFKEMYLTTFFVGEGLSGVLPSITSLIQGIGGNKECILINTTDTGEKIWETYTPPPRFNTMTFFLCVFVMMLCSLVGYTLLDQLKSVRRHYAAMKVSFGNDYVYDAQDNNNENHNNQMATDNNNVTQADTQLSMFRYCFLLVLLAVVTFFSNGIFNSIQSYSTLPYGNDAYHLSTTLSVMANPVACFLALFLPHTSMRSILSLTTCAAILNIYVFVTAGMSPNPPLANTLAGTIIIIITWTLLVGLISYIKLSISTVMRNQGGKSLVWAGGVTQIGSLFGSIMGFILVNVTKSFTAASPTDC